MENILITESVNRKWFFSTELSPIDSHRKTPAICTPAHSTHTHAILRTNKTYTNIGYHCSCVCAKRHVALYPFYSFFVTNCSFSICLTPPSLPHFAELNLLSFYSRRTYYIIRHTTLCEQNIHRILPAKECWIKYRGAYRRMVSTFITCKSAIFLDTCTFCTHKKKKQTKCMHRFAAGIEMYFCA